MCANLSAANQEVLAYATEMFDRSEYSTLPSVGSATCFKSVKSNTQYRLVRIADPSSELADQFCSLMEESFTPEECDTRETVAQMIRSASDPNAFSHAFYQGVLNDKGQMVAILNWDLLPTGKRSDGRQDGVISIGFIVTTPVERNHRLTLPLYSAMLRLGVEDAEKRGIDLRFVLAETVSTAEGHFQKALGLRRLYVTLEGSRPSVRVFHEMEYLQPPLDFTDEGEAADGAGFVAEHLMLRGFGPEIQTISSSSLMSAVHGIYKAYAGLGATGNPVRKDEILLQGLDRVQASLMDQAIVHLISQSVRNEMQEQGILFEEHVEADKD